MSGVTDAPFRRLAAALGAGLVVSEMTASDDLVNGRPMSLLRCEATGIGPHVVQLAGCETKWMAEGARIAEAAGAEIIDINMGCPARHVTGGQSGSALMRDLDHALRLIEATIAAVKVPVTLKMRLGWDERSLNAPELARRARGRGRADDFGARPHALPVLQGRCRLERGARRQGCDRHSARRQRRHHFVRGRGVRARTCPAPTPSWSAAARRASRGCPVRSGAGSRPASSRRRRRSPSSSIISARFMMRFAVTTACGSAFATRASISAGRWRLRRDAAARRRPRSRPGAAKILTSEDPAGVDRSLQDAFDDFAWSAAA